MAGNQHSVALGVMLAGLVGGCSDEPSFRLRWRVSPPHDADAGAGELVEAPALLSPVLCTQVGINEVRLEAYTVEETLVAGENGAADTMVELETLVGERTHPCFPPEFSDPDTTVNGFTLPPGDYRIKLRGLRRDGAEWEEPGANGVPLPLATFVFPDLIPVKEDATPRLQVGDDQDADPEIPAPPQCDDGVDNDIDGLVDASDPSCQAAGGTLEGSQVFPHQFQLGVTFLNKNPNVVEVAHCDGLGVGKIRVYDPDNPQNCLATDATEALDAHCLAVISCQDAISLNNFFSSSLSDELTHVAVVATKRPPHIEGVAVTVPKLIPVAETGSTIASVDFADSDFLEPIKSRAEVNFLLFPGVTNLNSCVRHNGVGVSITQLVFEARDAHNVPLASPLMLETGGTLDGVTPFSCAAPLLTTILTWGGFTITAAEARTAAGETCFRFPPEGDTKGFPLAPGTKTGFDPDDPDLGGILQFARVVAPPPSCVECIADAECAPLMCDETKSICVECLETADCDSGFKCLDTACVDD